MKKELEVVVRRFPLRSGEIARLSQRSETFCGLCQDISDAESTLARWSNEPPSGLTRARTAEYATLVEELSKEIEQMLDAASADTRH